MSKTDTQFKKGQSGNPEGKPKGARNRTTLAIEALLEGEAEELTRKAVSMALAGDCTALRLCLERIYPVRRERPIMMELPDIEDAAGVTEAMRAVIDATATGTLLPSEGQVLTSMLDSHRRAIELESLEQRISVLEQAR